MNPSIKYINQLVSEGRFGNKFPAEWDNAKCTSFIDVLSQIYPDMKSVIKENVVSYKLTTDGNRERNITIVYEPKSNFQWATSEMCYSDGTLIFTMQLYKQILNRILQGEIYYKETASDGYIDNAWDYDVQYTVGDFCLMNEYGDWDIPDKPWMKSKDTVCIPLAIQYVNR